MKIISVLIFGTHQWSLSFSRIIKNWASLAYYRQFFNFDIGYTEAESSPLFILEGCLFQFIICVVFTDLPSIFPSSSIGNRMLCSLNLIFVSGPLTCWMYTLSKETSWVYVRDVCCYLSYYYGTCLISTSSLL